MRFWKEIAKIHIGKESDGAVSNTAPVFFTQKAYGFFMQYFSTKAIDFLSVQCYNNVSTKSEVIQCPKKWADHARITQKTHAFK